MVDEFCLLHRLSTKCFGAYGHLQVDELTKKTHKQLYFACILYTVEGFFFGLGYEISCVLGREWGVYMGLYYANLSFVEFRTMILGIHAYVYIGYHILYKITI